MAHEQACPSRLLSSSPTHLSTHLAIIPSTQCSIRGTLPRTLEYSTAINAQGILPRAKRKGKEDHDGSGTIGQQRITWETPTVCSDRKQQPCMSTYTSSIWCAPQVTNVTSIRWITMELHAHLFASRPALHTGLPADLSVHGKLPSCRRNSNVSRVLLTSPVKPLSIATMLVNSAACAVVAVISWDVL